MNITKRRTEIILEALDRDFTFTEAIEYGEPGYIQPEEQILMANWNNYSPQILDYLEEAGYELQWYDEWIVDYSSGKAYRCVSNSFDWKPSYICNDWTNNEVIGVKDIEQDNDLAEDYIENCLMNDPDIVSLAEIDYNLEKLGFEEIPEPYYSGIGVPKCESPEGIYFKYKATHDVVFTDLESRGFTMKFKVWVRRHEV